MFGVIITYLKLQMEIVTGFGQQIGQQEILESVG